MNSYDYLVNPWIAEYPGMGRSTHVGVTGTYTGVMGLGDASPQITTYLDASGAPVDAGDPSAVFGLDVHGSLVNLYTATTLPGGTESATSCMLNPSSCIGAGTPLNPKPQTLALSNTTLLMIAGGFMLLMVMTSRRR